MRTEDIFNQATIEIKNLREIHENAVFVIKVYVIIFAVFVFITIILLILYYNSSKILAN